MNTVKPSLPVLVRLPETNEADVTSEEKKSDIATSPVLRAVTSPTSPFASIPGAQQRSLALRANLQDTAGRLEEKSEPEVKREIDDIEKYRPTEQEIEAAWQTIVDNDEKNSALCGTRSMSDNDEIAIRKEAYMQLVNAWLNAPGTLTQIARQKFEIQHKSIQKADMRPGDILLRKEIPPQSFAHATTLKFQTKSNLNGIEPNNGDHNVFHVSLWIGDTHEPDMDPFVEIAEARGGLGTTNTMRVVAQSIQTGQYSVYRARPEYGLSKEARKLLLERFAQEASSAPAVLLLGKASSVVAEIFAEKVGPYSKSTLSTSMRNDAKFTVLTEPRKQDAIRLAADPHQMSHVGTTSDTDVYRDIRTAENEANGTNKSVVRDGGDSCSTFIVRTAQTAALQIAASSKLDILRSAQPESAILSESERDTIGTAIRPTEDGDVNDEMKEILAETLSSIGGLLANNAEGIAPKTVEHFCRDTHDFIFVGVLTVEPCDVLREEKRFDADGRPIMPKSESVASDTVECCVVS